MPTSRPRQVGPVLVCAWPGCTGRPCDRVVARVDSSNFYARSHTFARPIPMWLSVCGSPSVARRVRHPRPPLQARKPPSFKGGCSSISRKRECRVTGSGQRQRERRPRWLLERLVDAGRQHTVHRVPRSISKPRRWRRPPGIQQFSARGSGARRSDAPAARALSNGRRQRRGGAQMARAVQGSAGCGCPCHGSRGKAMEQFEWAWWVQCPGGVRSKRRARLSRRGTGCQTCWRPSARGSCVTTSPARGSNSSLV